jgi:hypothetical protein
MSIFSDVKSSIYGPHFYKAQLHAPTTHVIGYFSKLMLMYAFVMMVIFSFFFVPLVTRYISERGLATVVSYYPEELTISIKDGKASTNVQEPYAIPFPPQEIRAEGMKVDTTPTNLLVIDTASPFTVEKFKTYDTAALLTSEFIVAEKSNGQISVQKLQGIPNMDLNRAQLTEWGRKVLPYVKLLIPLVLLGGFVAVAIVTSAANLLLLLILTLITWIVGLVRKTGIGYGGYYKLGLYALTPLVILGIFETFFNLPWIVDWLIFFVLFFINTRDVKKHV